MLTKKNLMLGLTLSLLVAACSPLAVPDPGDPKPAAPASDTPAASPSPAASGDGAPAYAPQAGDSALTRGPAFLDENQLLTLESAPPEFVLELAGSLPTPCHQLRVAVGQPAANGQIKIEVYSLVDPDRICAQVLKDFEASVPLGTLPAGQTYTVWVNDAAVGELKP